MEIINSERDHHIENCKKLMTAILLQAFKDLKKKNDCKEKREAKAWFKNDKNFVGSFIFICDYLNLNEKNIKKKLDKESLI